MVLSGFIYDELVSILHHTTGQWQVPLHTPDHNGFGPASHTLKTGTPNFRHRIHLRLHRSTGRNWKRREEVAQRSVQRKKIPFHMNGWCVSDMYRQLLTVKRDFWAFINKTSGWCV
jgi:hypothetical protein